MPHEEQEDPTFFVDDCTNIPCDGTKELVLPQKNIEESLSMGYINESIPFESTSKGDYLFKDLVDKYITKMEDQGCTKLACISI